MYTGHRNVFGAQDVFMMVRLYPFALMSAIRGTFFKHGYHSDSDGNDSESLMACLIRGDTGPIRCLMPPAVQTRVKKVMRRVANLNLAVLAGARTVYFASISCACASSCGSPVSLLMSAAKL